MTPEEIKRRCPEFEAIKRTLRRKGPACEDFYTGYIRDLKTHIGKLLEALAEARKAQEWRPIAEAPKKGPFLAFQHVVEDWDDMDNYWIAEWFEGELDCGASNPTDWMPLPQPPKEGV